MNRRRIAVIVDVVIVNRISHMRRTDSPKYFAHKICPFVYLYIAFVLYPLSSLLAIRFLHLLRVLCVSVTFLCLCLHPICVLLLRWQTSTVLCYCCSLWLRLLLLLPPLQIETIASIVCFIWYTEKKPAAAMRRRKNESETSPNEWESFCCFRLCCWGFI